MSKNQLDELITVAPKKGYISGWYTGWTKIKSANIRLKENYKDSKKWFEYIADKDSKSVGRCMKEAFVEEFDEWWDSLMRKIDRYELIEEKTKEEE